MFIKRYTGNERSISCKVNTEYDRTNIEIKKKKDKHHQRDYNKIVEGLSKRKWGIKRFIDEWNLSMNLIG